MVLYKKKNVFLQFENVLVFVIVLVQIGTGHPRPSSDDDMESPFPKELTLQQVEGMPLNDWHR